eukprot:10114311-Ditylum_brightwellii.AAC.1
MNQEEEVIAGATILMMLIIIVHQQVDVIVGEDMLIMKMVVHTIMKLKCNRTILWLECKC